MLEGGVRLVKSGGVPVRVVCQSACRHRTVPQITDVQIKDGDNEVDTQQMGHRIAQAVALCPGFGLIQSK